MNQHENRLAALRSKHSGYVFAELRGKLVNETKDQLKFQIKEAEGIWINKKDIRHITYAKGGDSFSLRMGKKVEAIEIPRWLAGEHKLNVSE